MLDNFFDKIWPYTVPQEIELGNLDPSVEDYIVNRVNDQINWYDKKSMLSQKKYKFFTFISIFCSALTPVAANLLIADYAYRLIVSMLGVIVTLSQAIINMSKYNEQWIEYRTVCETLKQEKYMFIVSAGVYRDYSDYETFIYFTERIESIISQENVNWANIKKQKKEETKSE